MSVNVKVIIPRNEVVLIDIDGIPLFVESLTAEEKLVDVGKFNDFIKPLYDEKLKDFKESATPEEIANAIPAPQPNPNLTGQQLTDIIKFALENNAEFRKLVLPIV